MSGQNSIIPFATPRAQDLFNALGITQFQSETNWFQVIGGLLIQGGFIDNASTGATITFNTSFTKQILGVFLIPVAGAVISTAVNTVTVDDFVLVHNSGGASDFYWFAIGV